MNTAKDIAARIGLFVAGSVFKLMLLVCALMFIFWVGRTCYFFGYQVFNQQPVSPGEGQEVVVIIPQGTSEYEIGKILAREGLISDPLVFFVQEQLSNYRGELKSGTYQLSTAYTPDRIMSVLSGREESGQEGG